MGGSQESHVVGEAMEAWADKAGLQPLLPQHSVHLRAGHLSSSLSAALT